MSSVLYQLYYKDEQKESLFPFAIPYKTEGLTIFFENYWIAQLVTESKADKIAVCSHKLAKKMRERVPPHTKLTQEALDGYYDVLSFTRNSKDHRMLQRAAIWHKDFLESIHLLFRILGFKWPREVKQPIYQNHFSAKAEIYKEYVEKFLKPAMDAIIDDKSLWKYMTADSGYTKLNKWGDIQAVKEGLGLDYYPLCPFVLERCFSIWIDMKGIKVTYL